MATPANINALSKSQKKRMKQKAAKAKKEAEQKNQSEAVANRNALSPHEKLCNDLIRKGYELPEIEKSLEEMWNLGLQYDDFHSALIYLEGIRAQQIADAEKKLAAEAAASRIENMTVVDPPTPLESVISEENTEKTEKKDEGEVSKWEEQESECTSSVVESESAPTAPSSLSGSESIPRPTDLASKLDIAAKFENLNDAIIALAEWVNKAAKAPQLISLCTVGQVAQRPALSTVVKRAIECKEDSDFESILTAFLSLATGIFVSFTNKSNVEAKSSLSDALKYSRDAMKITMKHQSNEIDSIFVANSMVEAVADQITQSFKSFISNEYKSYETDHADQAGNKLVSIEKLEEEIETLLSEQPVYNGGGVLELMSRRDCRKAAAEKSGAVTKLVLANGKIMSIRNGVANNSHTSGSTNSSLLPEIFGGQLHSFQKSRSIYNKMESRLNSLNASWVQERNQLSTHLDSCEEELKRINLRKEEVQKELDLLNAESKRVSTKQEMFKERMEAIFNSSSTPEVDNMKTELKNRAEMILVEDKVTGVLDKLSVLKNSFAGKIFKSTKEETKKLDLDPSEVQSKMESYLILSKNYFITEADCVSFMQNRVTKIQLDAKELQREIAECTALGMATNVSKMTSSLDSLNRNRVEDEGVISLLRGDAEKIRDDIISRFRDYSNSSNIVTPSHENLLKTIGSILSRVGIDYNHLIFSSTQEKNIIQETKIESNGLHPEQIAPPPGIEPSLPNLKLSWASSVASKSQAKSLVDIQREELSRKVN